MTAKAWCELHVISFDAAVGCKDCHAMAAEALRADMQPVPCQRDLTELAAAAMQEMADEQLDEPFRFAWDAMAGFWG